MTTILGPDGQPIDLKAALRTIETPQTAELGSIVAEFDRHPSAGLTPAKLNTVLRQAEQGDLVAQAELADDMQERDAHLYAELSKRCGAITALQWSIEEPDKASAEEKALTERVREWVSMITAHANGVDGGMDVLLQAMTAGVLPGYAPIEKVWRLDTDSTGRPVRIPHCTLQPQRWFTLSPDRRRFLLRSQTKMVEGAKLSDGSSLPPRMGEELKPFAWLMHVHPARNGYLARMSLARSLVWPYLYKNYAVRDLAEFLEIYGLPLRLGKYPSGASDEEKLTLLRAVTNIGHNAAGIIPQGMLIEFQNASAGTEVPFVAMWDRMDAAQSKAILGQTLSASEGSKGSHALGQVHNEVRMDIRDADARLYESSFNRQVIAQLCVLNAPNVNLRRLPRLVLDTGEAEDLEVYANNLPKLAQAGLRIRKKWVHEKLRIPEPEAGEEVLEVAEPPPAPGIPGARPPGAAGQPTDATRAALLALLTGALAKPAAAPPVDLVDELVAEQTAQWQPLLAPLVEPLLAELDKAVAAGESLEAFAARVPELVKLMDGQPITEDLARAAFSARLAGEADLDLERP
jgi:phage gp29-like protein